MTEFPSPDILAQIQNAMAVGHSKPEKPNKSAPVPPSQTKAEIFSLLDYRQVDINALKVRLIRKNKYVVFRNSLPLQTLLFKFFLNSRKLFMLV